MARNPETPLSRRERQILDIIYAAGAATAAEVQEAMEDAPSYSAVRGLLRVLGQKGHLKHRRKGVRNVYEPTRTHRTAGRSAMKRALHTYFSGDLEQAMNALLEASNTQLEDDEVAHLRSLIERAKSQEEGR